MEDFRDCFSDVPDPRAANARHDLSELLFITLAAVLCGAESCADMAEFGAAKEDVLRLERGIPSHDTFSRVFRSRRFRGRVPPLHGGFCGSAAWRGGD